MLQRNSNGNKQLGGKIHIKQFLNVFILKTLDIIHILNVSNIMLTNKVIIITIPIMLIEGTDIVVDYFDQVGIL